VTARDADRFSVQVIGRVQSPFPEKFGIPRQPGLVNIPASIEMLPPFDAPEMFEGLEAFSHLWLSFIFSACQDQGWKKRVRPPRLGGNVSKGVFATRSPFRPNHLGLSVVKLDRIEAADGCVKLHILGADLLDGTPVVDIKPYVSYTDSVSGACSGFAEEAPDTMLQVVFSPQAGRVLKMLPQGEALKDQITALVSLDPRPAYRRDDTDARTWGMRFSGLDIHWQVEGDQALVTGIDVVQ
jgi:tRNA-Thr(GGU) m(6)t(6)A37 methyltransferase TsaA